MMTGMESWMGSPDDEDDGNNDNDKADESVIDYDKEDEVDAEFDLESQDNKDVIILQYYLYLLVIEI